MCIYIYAVSFYDIKCIQGEAQVNYIELYKKKKQKYTGCDHLMFRSIDIPIDHHGTSAPRTRGTGAVEPISEAGAQDPG